MSIDTCMDGLVASIFVSPSIVMLWPAAVMSIATCAVVAEVAPDLSPAMSAALSW